MRWNGAVRQMRTSLQYPYPALGLGRQKSAPLGESGGAGQLVLVAIPEVALRRKTVVDWSCRGLVPLPVLV